MAILKILEANKDGVKDVVRAAEDAALTMAELFPGLPCMQVSKALWARIEKNTD